MNGYTFGINTMVAIEDDGSPYIYTFIHVYREKIHVGMIYFEVRGKIEFLESVHWIQIMNMKSPEYVMRSVQELMRKYARYMVSGIEGFENI